jgi:hypothetical protein
MNKFLRYSLVCLFAILCGNSFAQTSVWEENWEDYADQVKKVLNIEGYTFGGTVTNEDGTYKSGTTLWNEKVAGGEAPELMIAKSGGSFTVNSIKLSSASADLTLSFKSNNGKIDITAEGATVGEVTKSGNDYSCTITPSASTISLTFTANSSSNVRVDDFKLIEGKPATQPAGLSWGTSSRTVTIGEENTFPTLTNDNNLPVTYSSSDQSVATINANGEITLVAAGKTTITATFAGNSEFDAGDASYELTVKEKTVITEVTVAQALEKINALGTEATGYVDNKAVFQVKGYVVGTPDWQRNPKQDNALYGNVEFKIADEKGGSNTLTVYHCNNLNNAKYTEETINNFKEGDLVVVEGVLQMYVRNGVGTPEISSCHLVSINGETSNVNMISVAIDANAPAFNLAGQRVKNGFKGIVIQNGKKIVK